jgi:hypothetical protein
VSGPPSGTSSRRSTTDTRAARGSTGCGAAGSRASFSLGELCWIALRRRGDLEYPRAERRHLGHVGALPAQVHRDRRQLVDDRVWYRSTVANEHFRPLDCDFIVSMVPLPDLRAMASIKLFRAWDDRPFTERELCWSSWWRTSWLATGSSRKPPPPARAGRCRPGCSRCWRCCWPARARKRSPRRWSCRPIPCTTTSSSCIGPSVCVPLRAARPHRPPRRLRTQLVCGGGWVPGERTAAAVEHESLAARPR